MITFSALRGCFHLFRKTRTIGKPVKASHLSLNIPKVWIRQGSKTARFTSPGSWVNIECRLETTHSEPGTADPAKETEERQRAKQLGSEDRVPFSPVCPSHLAPQRPDPSPSAFPIGLVRVDCGVPQPSSWG